MDLFTVTGDGNSSAAGPFNGEIDIAPVGDPLDFKGGSVAIEYSDVDNDDARWASTHIVFNASNPQGQAFTPGDNVSYYLRGVGSGFKEAVSIPFMSTNA